MEPGFYLLSKYIYNILEGMKSFRGGMGCEKSGYH